MNLSGKVLSNIKQNSETVMAPALDRLPMRGWFGEANSAVWPDLTRIDVLQNGLSERSEFGVDVNHVHRPRIPKTTFARALCLFVR